MGLLSRKRKEIGWHVNDQETASVHENGSTHEQQPSVDDVRLEDEAARLEQQLIATSEQADTLEQSIQATESGLAAARQDLGLDISEPAPSLEAERGHVLRLREAVAGIKRELAVKKALLDEKIRRSINPAYAEGAQPPVTTRETERRTDLNFENAMTQALPEQPIVPNKELFKTLEANLTPAQVQVFRKLYGDYALSIGGFVEKNLRHREGLKNWQAEGWTAYRLAGREGLVKENYPWVLTENPQQKTTSERAAALTYTALQLDYSYNVLGPDPEIRMPRNSPDGMERMDTDSFHNLFRTTRVPGKEADRQVIKKIDKRDPRHGHFIVMIRGHQIKVPSGAMQSFLNQSRSKTPDELKKTFDAIIAEYKDKPPAPPLGAVSAGPRKDAAKFHEELLKDGHNRQLQEDLESAAFVVCLDIDAHPQTLSEISALVRDGGGIHHNNREFNKGVQIIVAGDSAEGVASGLNIEHSMADGAVSGQFAAAMGRRARDIEFGFHGGTNTEYEEMSWHVPPALEAKATAINTKVIEGLNDREIQTIGIEGEWINAFKSNEIFPDTGIQISMELAHYLKYGEVLTSNEQVDTRNFQGGRINSTFNTTHKLREFIHFVGEHAKGATPEERRTQFEQLMRDDTLAFEAGVLLHNAVAQQDQLIENAKEGKGVESQLMAQWAASHVTDPQKASARQYKADKLFSQRIFGLRNYLQPMVVTSNLRPRNVGKEIQAGGTVPSRRKDNLAIGYFYPSTLNVRNKITFDIRAEGKKYKGYPAEFEQYMTEALDMVSALAPRAKRTRETLSTPAP